MHCKDCRFWFANADTTAEEDESYNHHSPSLPKNAALCIHPKIGGSYNDPAHDADDAVNSYETIITGPMFGCVHFSSQLAAKRERTAAAIAEFAATSCRSESVADSLDQARAHFSRREREAQPTSAPAPAE
jgi:hypothetical protein